MENSVSRNLKFQSLLALSAGAIGLPQIASAQSIVYSGTIDEEVGFSAGFNSVYMLDLPGSTQLELVRQSTAESQYVHDGTHRVSFKQAAGYARVKGYNTAGLTFAKRNSAGLIWDNVGGAAGTNGLLGARRTTNGVTAKRSDQGPGSFSDKYVAFEFKDSTAGNAVRYGWALFSMTETPSSGPDVTLESYAYNTTGAEIPMGAVPEPSTGAAVAFGALALGAVRRWRASKQAA